MLFTCKYCGKSFTANIDNIDTTTCTCTNCGGTIDIEEYMTLAADKEFNRNKEIEISKTKTAINEKVKGIIDITKFWICGAVLMFIIFLVVYYLTS